MPGYSRWRFLLLLLGRQETAYGCSTIGIEMCCLFGASARHIVPISRHWIFYILCRRKWPLQIYLLCHGEARSGENEGCFSGREDDFKNKPNQREKRSCRS